jgi:zinc protease
VRAHHETHWRPAAAHLIVAGPVEAEDVVAAATQHLGAWSGSGPGHRTFAPHAAGGRRIVLVDRPGSVQSELRVGQLGIDRRSPRYFAAMVLGAMLGGVFGSRLNLRLREELGYTYGARAGFDPRRAVGPFSAAAAVQTEVTADALRETVEILTRVRDAAPDEVELHEIRDFLVGIFPLRFETTGGVAMAIEPLAVYGLSDDWWQTYRSHLEGVGADDVHAAARDLLRPDDYLMLVVGDADKVQSELEATGLGPLEVAAAE